jgi:hypothetical protein
MKRILLAVLVAVGVLAAIGFGLTARHMAGQVIL